MRTGGRVLGNSHMQRSEVLFPPNPKSLGTACVNFQESLPYIGIFNFMNNGPFWRNQGSVVDTCRDTTPSLFFSRSV
jgi:hypothetical protein